MCMKMSEHPFHALFQTFAKVSNSIQTQLSNLIAQSLEPSPTAQKRILSSSSKVAGSSDNGSTQSQPKDILSTKMGKSVSPLTKEELGRSTWTFLHTLAAQYPDKPTRQQKKDVKELMSILSRMYPCKECADHFQEILRSNPVQAGSHAEFSQWLCHVHNTVNRSLNKPVFPCERVDARWGKLECEQRACDLLGITGDFGDNAF
ncbi:FAD-linked sulfhydryl oxidase ERV1-like [Pyrus ussuriensis x Pyrus communis]|uniref:Sulfhydryl oxidase n=1 Tax=Pyrus ussuriensis x Pyrus communis TaxID=2448454 RepID=A0A5N5FIN2_9ROSA|nr:FAD-linked sulfhydryl oxidase ERV1 [Pyrus x bretschneideri]KAB2602787.1 FAD-linked sulfhydryl oxidase ERV1-like [Pyrus ussuriensis x Pyrus communis]